MAWRFPFAKRDQTVPAQAGHLVLFVNAAGAWCTIDESGTIEVVGDASGGIPQGGPLTADLAAGTKKITGLGTPSANTDADTKGARNTAIGTAIAAASVRTAAGVPTGAPTAGEVPFAYNTTLVTGGFYYWNGAAWVKVATIL